MSGPEVEDLNEERAGHATCTRRSASSTGSAPAGAAVAVPARASPRAKLLGQQCPVCSKVYMPPRGSCPIHGVPTDEEVELPDRGTVTTFCVVNIPFSDLAPEVPYVCAQVLLDGADTALFGLIAGVPANEVRMGLRVRAEWAAPRRVDARTSANIKWWEPTGEPDADYDAYKDYI